MSADPTDPSRPPRGTNPYQPPTIVKYGGLAELVQFAPNRGRDGETRWIDCTSG